MGEDVKNEPVKQTVPFDLKFPTGGQVGTTNDVNSAGNSAQLLQKEAAKDPANNPNPLANQSLVETKPEPEEIKETPHDPLGEIFKSNQEVNTFPSKEEDLEDSQHKHAAYLLTQSNTARIHTVLKNKGMDSQQSAQALKEIKQIIED
jgi:hypothetical protein